MANETTVAEKPKDVKNGDKQPEVLTGPQPTGPTPIEPEVYYNLNWRVPGLVVQSQEQKDALDPNEWAGPVQIPPPTRSAPRTTYPVLYVNNNVPPVVVISAEHAKSIGTAYAPFTIPLAVLAAANAAAADAEKNQKQQQKQDQAGQPKPPTPQPQHK